MRKTFISILVIVLTLSACSSSPSPSPTPSVSLPTTAPVTTTHTPGEDKDTSSERSYAGKTPAPEFPAGLAWLNTAQPFTLAQLQGKIVILDFWTYGCINCIHIIPDLKRLEKEYPQELVVIGVHSAKFENEARIENIRQIILRYGLTHPVINDKDTNIRPRAVQRSRPP
jgi:thiol-disulfide isomerase/thioredoxin